MKNFLKKAIYLGIVLSLFSFAGCQNVLESEQASPSTNMGRVTVVIGDGAHSAANQSMRTVAPNLGGFTKYTLSFTGPVAQVDIDITSDSTSVTLPVGRWTISAKGYTGTSSYTEVAEGSVTVDVTIGVTAQAALPLKPKTGGATGTLSYSLAIPSGLDSAQLVITTLEGASVTGSPWTLTSGTTNTGSKTLDAGLYLVQVSLEKDTKYAGLTEALHIYSGLTSDLTKTYTDADFDPSENFKVTAGNTMLAISWDPIPGVTGYEVYYSTSNSTPAGAADLTITDPFVDIEGLTNAIPYYIWFKAVNGDEAGDFSSVATGTPAALNLSGITGTWVDSSWGSVLFIKDDGNYQDWYYAYDESEGIWIGDSFMDDYTDVSYSGQIIATTDTTQDTGFIYIKFGTDHPGYGANAGEYYAIQWKDKTVSPRYISTSGAYKSGGEVSTATLAEAVAEFTEANSYFASYTVFNEFEYGPDEDFLRNFVGSTWKADENATPLTYDCTWFTITEDTSLGVSVFTWEEWLDLDGDGVFEEGDGDMAFIHGVIKGTVSLGGRTSGYIFIKGTEAGAACDEEYYHAVKWENFSSGSPSTVEFTPADEDADYFEDVILTSGSDFAGDFETSSYTKQ
ncbi:MAG: fibronectin type III domain-containing protein [Treponema sp.]|jgi:hypothetical protein|nr:fibronectin type III domain-containing protein [Treponema sp.]